MTTDEYWHTIAESYREKPQEHCEDAISRQAVLSMQYRIDDSATLSTRDVVNVDDIEDLPPVTPKQRTGHWIYIRNSEVNGLKIVKCSECGKRTYGSGKYCPNCGCRMFEPQERSGEE